jgi:CheY-like chemotaxis protein
MRNRDYLAIFMDLGLIDMDGLECTRRIRDLEIGTNKRMPIIAITARTDTDAIKECMDAGMDDFLSKPFTLEQMLSRLCSWLDKHDSN